MLQIGVTVGIGLGLVYTFQEKLVSYAGCYTSDVYIQRHYTKDICSCIYLAFRGSQTTLPTFPISLDLSMR